MRKSTANQKFKHKKREQHKSNKAVATKEGYPKEENIRNKSTPTTK